MTRLLRLIVSVGLLAFLALRLDWGPMLTALAGLHTAWVAAAAALFLVTPVLASYRWQLLARPLGFRHRLRRFTGIYFLGMFFNLLLPTSVGGDVVRAWYLDGGRNRKMNALLCVVVDRATGLVMLIGMACCATLFQLDELPLWATTTVWAAAAATLGGLVFLPLVVRLVDRWQARRARPSADRVGWRYWLARLARIPAGVHAAVRQYRGRSGLIAYTGFLSLGIMSANVLVVWMLSRALGGQVPGSYFWVAVPVVTLLTLVPVSINGMGVREAGLGLLLAQAGAPAALGVTVGLLQFALYLAAGLIGALVYLSGRFATLPAELNVAVLPHPQLAYPTDPASVAVHQAA